MFAVVAIFSLSKVCEELMKLKQIKQNNDDGLFCLTSFGQSFGGCFPTQSCLFIFSQLMSALNTFERAKWKRCKTPFVI